MCRSFRYDRFDQNRPPPGNPRPPHLRVVSLGPIHGYGIAQRILQMSREAVLVQQGSLYPALHRPEYRKLLAADWKPSETGREAKFYRLTSRGEAQLQKETEGWTRLVDVVALILGDPEREAS